MGRFYGLKIKNGEMTIDDVPKLWKKATEKWLLENCTNAYTVQNCRGQEPLNAMKEDDKK